MTRRCSTPLRKAGPRPLNPLPPRRSHRCVHSTHGPIVTHEYNARRRRPAQRSGRVDDSVYGDPLDHTSKRGEDRLRPDVVILIAHPLALERAPIAQDDAVLTGCVEDEFVLAVVMLAARVSDGHHRMHLDHRNPGSGAGARGARLLHAATGTAALASANSHHRIQVPPRPGPVEVTRMTATSPRPNTHLTIMEKTIVR